MSVTLKLIREKAGLTIIDLAYKSKVSLTTIYRIDKGEIKPSLKTLKKISEVKELKAHRDLVNEWIGGYLK